MFPVGAGPTRLTVEPALTMNLVTGRYVVACPDR
jgi:hypothetical protein